MPENIRVYGYHGTSAEAAEVIIQQGFNVSSNDYDWLGTGVYFFQDAPVRAWEWANQQHPTNPAVIRSTIRLEEVLFDRFRRRNFLMANPKRAAELIRKHFAEITTEQFLENLKKHCPEIFEDDIVNN